MQRAGKLAGAFVVYTGAVFGVMYFVSSYVAPYVWPAATRWILAAYVLLGALGLLASCLGGLRRASRLDELIGDLEKEARRSAPVPVAPPPPPPAEPETPSDEDVEDLLTELHRISQAVEAGRRAFEEPEAPPAPEDGEAAKLRAARLREIRRLRALRESVTAAIAGPAFASAAVLGVFASLLPGADGFLLSNLQVNAWLGLTGAAWLAGIAGYAIASFRGVRPA